MPTFLQKIIAAAKNERLQPDTTPLQKAAADLVRAWDEFSEQIKLLPEDNLHAQHWEYVDSQSASEVYCIASDIAKETT